MSNTISFDEHVLILEALKAGRSLRDIGKEFGVDHRKVGRIGKAANVYSIRSAHYVADPIVVPEVVMVDTSARISKAHIVSEMQVVQEAIKAPTQTSRRKIHFYGKNAYNRKRELGISWRQAVV